MPVWGYAIGRRLLGSGALLLSLTAAGPASNQAVDPRIAPLAAALANASDRDQAIQAELQLEALRQQSLTPTVRLLVRRAVRERAENAPHAALSDLDDALALQPDNAVLWREHADGRAALGDLDGAVGDLGGALARDPGDVVSWQNLTSLEMGREDWKAAYKAWQHALSLDPMLPEAQKRLDRLRRRAFGQPA